MNLVTHSAVLVRYNAVLCALTERAVALGFGVRSWRPTPSATTLGPARVRRAVAAGFGAARRDAEGEDGARSHLFDIAGSSSCEKGVWALKNAPVLSQLFACPWNHTGALARRTGG